MVTKLTVDGIEINVLTCKKRTMINLQFGFMPRNPFDLNEELDRNKFNKIYQWIRQHDAKGYLAETTDEKYSIFKENYMKCAFFYIIDQSASCCATVFVRYGCYLFELSLMDRGGVATNTEGKKIYGYQAFARFKKKCEEQGIDIEAYAVSKAEGLKLKTQIGKPLIKLSPFAETNVVYENVHHIDFHNSYPAGLVNTHPEFREVVEYFYKNRKVDPINKAVLNLSIGFMQSGKIQYRLAQLSKDAINDNNKRVRQLADNLHYCGRKVLLFNTDGIWYQGDIYSGPGEGKELGQWENDHINCTLRIKSAGSYEFIEDGHYHPVVRGKTRLDNIKPREEWQWGDIYNNDTLISYVFDFENGIITEVEDE